MFTRPRRITRGAAAATIAALLAGPLLAIPASATEAPPEPIANPEVRGTAVQQPVDRFIVKFKDQAQASSKSRGNAYGVKVKELGIAVRELKVMGTGATVVETSRELETGEAEAFVASLEANNSVEYAEPDQILQVTSLSPVDPLYSYQWPIFDPLAGIDAEGAWGATTGRGITVAVIDTGITPHVDLNANVLPGYDMISDPAKSRDGNGRDPDATDEGDYGESGECGTASSSWHGTHVAGTIAAAANDQGVVGIAPGAKILPVRALAECGGWMSDIVDGVTWASGGAVPGAPANPNPARVINLSLAGSGPCTTSWQSAINGAVGRGSVVVAAAGNDSQDALLTSPANCEHVIAVAASGPDGGKAPYSNYGDIVDVVAPGGNMDVDTLGGILSTFNMGSSGPVEDYSDQAYAFYQGTSMAAPHVAATAALMLALNGTLSPASVENILKGTTRPLQIECEWGCGTGLINARAAVQSADVGELPPPAEPGTVIDPGPVVITGTPAVGGTLTVEIGAWEPAPVEVSVQWYRDADLIPGATGTTYNPTAADASRSLHVVATGTKPGYSDATRKSASTGLVQLGRLISLSPRVSSTGAYVVGTTLTINAGTWQPAPVAIRYQWYRGAEQIPNGTNASYTLSTADIGKSVWANVTGEKAGYLPVTHDTVHSVPVQTGGLTAGIPTITGNTSVGQTVTATTGDWSPVPESFLYEWLADGQSIPDSGSGKTYTLQPGDVDKHVSVRVTGLRSGAIPASATSAATAPVSRGALTGTAPAIKGTPTFGQTLTVDAGIWTTGTAFEYRWFRDDGLLADKTGSTYAITLEDLGHRVSVQAIGTKLGYDVLTKVSAPTAAVTAASLTAPVPTVAGIAKVGSTLTATTAAWTAGTTLKYQWYRTGVPITGATGATLALTAADLGQTITVGVTGSKTGYTSITQSSARTAAVAAGTLSATKPTVTGTTKVGYTLTANTGTWTSGATFTYQWFRTGVPITGATGKTYALTAADLGKNISVGVTGSKAGYTNATVYSVRTAAVVAGTLTAPKPTVSGTTRITYTLTANTGTWTAGTTLRYQWYRTGVAITGATAKTYKLTSADLGKTMSVGVTGSKAGYANATVYSVRTAAVTR
ncbi:S8 family serine peptidase [Arthrobacter sp. MDB2-24]